MRQQWVGVWPGGWARVLRCTVGYKSFAHPRVFYGPAKMTAISVVMMYVCVSVTPLCSSVVHWPRWLTRDFAANAACVRH
jgi:hypothetical protein